MLVFHSTSKDLGDRAVMKLPKAPIAESIVKGYTLEMNMEPRTRQPEKMPPDVHTEGQDEQLSRAGKGMGNAVAEVTVLLLRMVEVHGKQPKQLAARGRAAKQLCGYLEHSDSTMQEAQRTRDRPIIMIMAKTISAFFLHLPVNAFARIYLDAPIYTHSSQRSSLARSDTASTPHQAMTLRFGAPHQDVGKHSRVFDSSANAQLGALIDRQCTQELLVMDKASRSSRIDPACTRDLCIAENKAAIRERIVRYQTTIAPAISLLMRFGSRSYATRIRKATGGGHGGKEVEHGEDNWEQAIECARVRVKASAWCNLLPTNGEVSCGSSPFLYLLLGLPPTSAMASHILRVPHTTSTPAAHK
ncbi:hypothetical protein PENSPDRAFT_668581 [Peniophora sp. CONT]|nr:hypothetical protein PENSPDRAFT_668581 [Peniophora sp. CONT]